MLELNYSLAVQAVLFVALWLALKRFWFDPALRVIAERAKRSEGQVEEARKLEAEIERMRHEHQAALQHARTEAQREVADIMRRAEAEQKQLIAQANDEAQRTLADMRTRVAEDVAVARKTLSAHVGALAREVARTVMGRAV
jgi:F-type H+-transporting ATPase subunit b